MTTREVLVAARSLIDTPEKWTKGVSARAGTDGSCDVADPRAVCFCVFGALIRACGGDDGIPDNADDALASHVPHGFRGFVSFNDAPATTHADVMALFDRAIAACGDA